MSIEKNLHHILSEIEKTKRNSNCTQSVTLVAATKTQPFHLIQNIYSLGVFHIGENRIQEAASKFESFANMPNITRRFIGHLQSNKINKFMNLFDTIDSIDSYKLANKINTKAEQLKKSLIGLIEINTSGDKSKKGFKPFLTDEIIKCLHLDHLNINGLMTLGPYSQNPTDTRKSFVDLRKFLDQVNKEVGYEKLTELSMGMSGDFITAIEEGSTMVRVGTSLFGDRE